MQEILIFKGVWFIPRRPENQVAGNLKYGPSDGVELELNGAFETAPSKFAEEFPVILGILNNGKKITLFRCTCIHSSMNMPGYATERYAAHFLLSGDHFESEEGMRFSRVNMRLADFDNWLGIFGFEQMQYEGNTKEMKIEYRMPHDLIFQLKKEIACEFKFGLEYPVDKFRTEATIKQSCDISIGPNNGLLSLEELLEYSQAFNRFITLAYFRNPVIEEIRLIINESEIEFFFQRRNTYVVNKRSRSKRNFLFTYASVASKVNMILAKWFELEHLLSPTILALSESFFQSDTTVEFDFLIMAHAIETLHRRTKVNLESPVDQHKKKLAEIFDSVPGEYREWLKKKLEFSNEINLQQRMEEIAAEIPEKLRGILFKPTKEEFIKQFKWSRNYYTHYSKTLESKALYGEDLYMMTQRIRIILICLILREIGFSDDQVVRVIAESGIYLFNHIVKYEEVKEIIQIK